MQFGYVLYDPKRSKLLVLTKQNEVEYISSTNRENINKAFCLRDMSSMKSLYIKLKEKKLVDKLDIVNIQELYRSK
jgi:hypothetical protein|tara:strand:- start:219 stop:446 length:228 start_codon:yes stop_codon:yes gene_type:complete